MHIELPLWSLEEIIGSEADRVVGPTRNYQTPFGGPSHQKSNN